MRTSMLVLLCGAALSAADDGVEPTVLPEFVDAQAWYTAECTVSFDPQHKTERGDGAIHLHIPIDHTTGEPAYPIGWPRAGLAPKTHFDWSRYDLFSFMLYTETSRDKLPATTLGLILSMPDRSNEYHLDLPARKGEWVKVTVPIEDLGNPKDIARVQWFISESNYKHLDTVDFYLADLTLGRYTRPTFLTFEPLERLVAGDAKYLPVTVHLAGVKEGESVAATVLVRQAGKIVAEVPTSMQRGKHRVVLPLPGKLPAGPAELAVRFAGGADAAKAPIVVVRGPFEEAGR
ncbi:MAG: hypothetical protein HYU66_28360 [Armatimonadetes bacterium]|nr:hypothetical protein [Armatimonadota bacterium]